MAGGLPSGTPGSRSAFESIMLLLAAGIGSGVMVLPRAMAAVGVPLMTLMFVFGWLISSLTTWILFRAVADSRSQPESIMTISSRLLSGSTPNMLGLISPQALGSELDPHDPHDPHAPFLSPGGGAHSVLERKRSTSVYDYKDRKRTKETARPTLSLPLPGPSYGDLLAMVWIPKMMVFLDLVLLVHQQLALTVYFLFISQFVAKLPYLSDCPRDLFILLISVPATKLAQLESIGGLARFASISPAVLLFMMCGIFWRWLFPDNMAPADFSHGPDPATAPAVMCIAVFSFMWHTNCVTVARELQDPSPTRCCLVVFVSTTVLLAAYTSLAFFGYETFGQRLRTVPTIMMLYSANDPIFMVVRFLLSISLFVAIPLNVYPVRESVLSLIRHNFPKYLDRVVNHQDFLSSILVVLPAILAINFPDVTQIITVIGGSLVSFLMIVFPVFIGELVLPMWVVWILQALAVVLVTFLITASLGLYGKPV
ncbi:SLC38A6 [Symbiodinium natans]|uniref:SLC38A6 protein n=1 Tax=Symbiodinium natans TaxID=878477 RepID=A0A812V3A0_9DINO|nr:SLC38A6 [Symbiodinium natans]